MSMRGLGYTGLEQEIPRQGLLDYFTRHDELLLIEIELLKQVLAAVKGVEIAPGEPIPIAPKVVGYVLRSEMVKIFDGFSNTRMGASTTYYPETLADCRVGVENVLVIVRSTCNQALSIQTIGDLDERATSISALNIESSQSCAATSSIGLGVDLSTNWYPFMGCAITTGSTAPTAGQVNAWVYLRRWVKEQ